MILLASFAAGLANAAPSSALSLAGQWRFALDRQNAGLEQKWFERTLPDRIKLPGSLPAQGIGDDPSVNTKWTGDIVDKSWFTAPEYAKYRQPGNVKVPFWLQPDKYYAGAAWYQRDIQIPSEWRDKRVVLTFERPHWETRVWLDGKQIGSNNSLSTPHEYDLGTTLVPGKHQLTIRIDNSLIVDIGVNSHSISDHTQGNWNGIVGRIELEATPPVWLDDIQTFPDAAAKSLRVKMLLHNSTGKLAQGKISVFVEPGPGSMPLQVLPYSQNFNTTGTDVPLTWEIPLGTNALLWDEFSPALYRLRANIRGQWESKTFEHDWLTSFGLRDISTQGTQFILNGHKTFIRGTLECCIFPKTGHPPTDVDSWKRIIRIAKAHGLNLLRFHSWCPPEAAFVAADELGFYYQVEIASWANQSTTLGDGKPVDQWLYEEAERILKAYGNHPSFLLMPYGNEPGGKRATEYLAKWVDHWKAADPRRLYTSGSGWPQIPENQFHVTPDPRIQSWGDGLKSRINHLPPETTTDYRSYIQKRTIPVISHEIGQWCVYPNFDEIPKYTGYLKPKNFEIFRETLAAHHMANQAHQFLLASGKLQALCYKEDIESALRTPGMGGFELLDLHDFPGQGTALVGVLDPFWDDKGYVTAKEYSRFCNSTVPLARLNKRVFTTDETLTAELEVAHFGPAQLPNAITTWKLVGDVGKIAASGTLPACNIPIDNGTALGSMRLELKDVPAPARYKLVVSLSPGERAGVRGNGTSERANSTFENDWDLWVYPPQVDTHPPTAVMMTDELNDAAVASLNSGGKVLLTIPANRVKGDQHGPVALGFSSIFWNTAWTHRQPPHTLGILCDPKAPALAEFPTDYHSNWQWWYLLSRAGAMILDDLPQQLRPTAQVVDDWVTNRKLALVFEGKVGPGKLLVCSVDLKNDLEQNPVARQMLHSLLDYMSSANFKPVVSLSPAQVRGLMTEPTRMQRLGARIVKCDSAQGGHEAERAIDGDPTTLWHTGWDEPAPGFPHELQIGFEKPVRLLGFTLLPRQDGNKNGWIKKYEFYVSADGQNWGAPVARGTFSADPQIKRILLDHAVEARFVRLTAVSGYAPGPWASLAEFEVIEP
ncbi:MAG TPA: discoidin domain-containing protein [Candidatus Binatia bacterium]|nr:discoidin domain-containing protein [Candidatus Binatia bacterium]